MAIDKWWPMPAGHHQRSPGTCATAASSTSTFLYPRLRPTDNRKPGSSPRTACSGPGVSPAGVHHLGPNAVDVPNALRHRGRVGDVTGCGVGGLRVPPAQQRGGRPKPGPMSGALVGEVVLGLVEPPGRVVAVDDLGRSGGDAVRPAAARADHYVRVAHGPAEKGGGQEGRCASVVGAQVGDAVEDARLDRQIHRNLPTSTGLVERGQQTPGPETAREGECDALGSTTPGEVVVCYHHARPGVSVTEAARRPRRSIRPDRTPAARNTFAPPQRRVGKGRRRRHPGGSAAAVFRAATQRQRPRR